MGGFKGALWEQPSSSSGQGAVRDNNLFHASYHTVGVRRPIWAARSAVVGITVRAVFSYPQMQKSLTELTYAFWQSEVWLLPVPHLLVPVGQLQRSAQADG